MTCRKIFKNSRLYDINFVYTIFNIVELIVVGVEERTVTLFSVFFTVNSFTFGIIYSLLTQMLINFR